MFHQYIILSKQRKKLIKILNHNKIQYAFHYPHAIHQLKALKKKFPRQKYVNAERIANEGISLPIDPNLKKNEIKKIIKVINSF